MTAEQLWFLNALVTIRIPRAAGSDGVSIIEHRVPHGDSPPLHCHHTEDEIFCITEGEFRVLVGGREQRAGPGAFLLAPKGVPHTYRAESPGGGCFLTVTTHGDFEGLVRALGHPPQRAGLPERGAAPSPAAVQALTEAAARYGIEIIGPPLQ